MKTSPFLAALASNITAYIKRAKRDGTTAMSADNLMQCVSTPSASLDGAPRGGNVRWQYAQTFRAVLAELPAARGFLLS